MQNCHKPSFCKKKKQKQTTQYLQNTMKQRTIKRGMPVYITLYNPAGILQNGYYLFCSWNEKTGRTVKWLILCQPRHINQYTQISDFKLTELEDKGPGPLLRMLSDFISTTYIDQGSANFVLEGQILSTLASVGHSLCRTVKALRQPQTLWTNVAILQKTRGQ